LPWRMGTCPRSARMFYAAAVMQPVIGSLLVRAVEKRGKARAEIVKMLQGFGCEQVGFMDNFDDCSLLLAFTHPSKPASRVAAIAYLLFSIWAAPP